jgi:hypothetical protein
MTTRFWLGTVSADHVALGVTGGFAQVGHGKGEPLRKMSRGDGFIYYSPKTSLTDGEPLQAFTAIGRIAGDETYQVEMSPDFKPWRRDVTYVDGSAVPIKPLLNDLSFTTGRTNWGFMFRRGHFEVTEADFCLIAASMGVLDRLNQ